MKIGFDAKRYFRNKTGLGNYSRTLIDGLIEHYPNHDYHVFSSSRNVTAPEGAELETPPRFSLFWRQIGSAIRIDKRKLNIYHGLSAELPIGKTKAKQVVTIHDLIFQKYPEYYKPIDRYIYARKTAAALSQADIIIASSERTKQDIIDISPRFQNKTEVVYQDCAPQFYAKLKNDDLKAFQSKYNLPDAYLVSVCKFEKRKNHLRLLQAYLTKKDELPHLLLVGRKGDTYSTVKQFIKDNGLHKNVSIVSDMPSEELVAAYQGSIASVFLSEYEGYGIPVAESMACGKPVLTSLGSSMEEICGSSGLCVNPLSIEDITKGLMDIANKETIEKLRAHIDLEKQKFSNALILEQHINIYNKLL